MGQLFENFEKVDIKVERKNTEQARKRAEAAEKQVEVAEKQVEAAEKRAKVAEKQVEAAERKAIRSCISMCQELGGSRETAVRKLMEAFELSKKKAEEQIDLFWKN